MDLHYSQTPPISSNAPHVFESPMDLHYSQTPRRDLYFRISLNPLWIYTTLKLPGQEVCDCGGLNPLWIYTTLKP